MTKKFILIIAASLFFVSGLYAQTDFREGYIITPKLDTLYGEIDYRGDVLMGQACRFRLAEQENETVYAPGEIFGYKIDDGKYYISAEQNGENVFLEYLVDGELDVYYLRDKKGDHYYLGKEGYGIAKIPYEEITVYQGATPRKFVSPQYFGVLNLYTSDAPELQAKIKNFKGPRHSNLIKLAEDYHYRVCGNEDGCIVYEKKTSVLKISPEFVGGFYSYKNVDNLPNLSNFQKGIAAHFWFPRANEKIYFRTGFIFMNLEVDDDETVQYRVPLQLEYIYPNGRVRPRVAYGLNIYKPFYQSVSLSGGLNIKLDEPVFFGITYEIEFTSEAIAIFPVNYRAQGLNFGLFVNVK